MAFTLTTKFCLLLVVVAATTHKFSVGIRTSGLVLKGLVQRAGFVSHQTWGAEKLDLLVWLAEQVKESVKGQVRMDLALRDLNEFLSAEDMIPRQGDAKHAIEQLLALRSRELKRRGVFESDDDVCLDCLADSDVERLFAVVPLGTPFEAGVDDFASMTTKEKQATASIRGLKSEGTSSSKEEQSEAPPEVGDTLVPASSNGGGEGFSVKYSPRWSTVVQHKLKTRGVTLASDVSVKTCDGTTLDLVFHDGIPQVSATDSMFPLKFVLKASSADL
jgi:hypothetical protein